MLLVLGCEARAGLPHTELTVEIMKTSDIDCRTLLAMTFSAAAAGSSGLGVSRVLAQKANPLTKYLKVPGAATSLPVNFAKKPYPLSFANSARQNKEDFGETPLMNSIQFDAVFEDGALWKMARCGSKAISGKVSTLIRAAISLVSITQPTATSRPMARIRCQASCVGRRSISMGNE